MKAYSIFDDFSDEAIEILVEAGIELDVHPKGKPRPDHDRMKAILEDYDCVIIGTSQKISPDMFDNVTSSKIIATASVGVDHIIIPDEKKEFINIINTPKANAQSVAEYTIGCALSCVKRLVEANDLYKAGKNNKQLHKKPEDLFGKTIGILGAGNVSAQIMRYASLFGMKVICWTKHPQKHNELLDVGVHFTSLSDLLSSSDIISVNLPSNMETRGLVSATVVEKIKTDSIFISVSRIDCIDIDALFDKAEKEKNFYICLDIDVNDEVVKRMKRLPNVLITPHIAGGTIETRNRMFRELANSIRELVDE